MLLNDSVWPVKKQQSAAVYGPICIKRGGCYRGEGARSTAWNCSRVRTGRPAKTLAGASHKRSQALIIRQVGAQRGPCHNRYASGASIEAAAGRTLCMSTILAPPRRMLGTAMAQAIRTRPTTAPVPDPTAATRTIHVWTAWLGTRLARQSAPPRPVLRREAPRGAPCGSTSPASLADGPGPAVLGFGDTVAPRRRQTERGRSHSRRRGLGRAADVLHLPVSPPFGVIPDACLPVCLAALALLFAVVVFAL